MCGGVGFARAPGAPSRDAPRGILRCMQSAPGLVKVRHIDQRDHNENENKRHNEVTRSHSLSSMIIHPAIIYHAAPNEEGLLSISWWRCSLVKLGKFTIKL